jgi:hypothetical protein
MGSIIETATSAPGQSSLTSNTKAPLALALNDYSSSASKANTTGARPRGPNQPTKAMAARPSRLPASTSATGIAGGYAAGGQPRRRTRSLTTGSLSALKATAA